MGKLQCPYNELYSLRNCACSSPITAHLPGICPQILSPESPDKIFSCKQNQTLFLNVDDAICNIGASYNSPWIAGVFN